MLILTVSLFFFSFSFSVRMYYCPALSIVLTGCALYEFSLLLAVISCWLECRTRDQKVATSNPGRSGRENFLLQGHLCVLTLIRYPFHPRATAVARKRHQLFCQKCMWEVMPKHAYTLDPTKSECADYAAVQA